VRPGYKAAAYFKDIYRKGVENDKDNVHEHAGNKQTVRGFGYVRQIVKKAKKDIGPHPRIGANLRESKNPA
jgi:hypothetical protein